MNESSFPAKWLEATRLGLLDTYRQKLPAVVGPSGEKSP
jgi:hypothetical protein